LAEGTGWQIGRLHIEDSSPRPDNLKKFPKTTGAEFFLRQAPQSLDGAPTLQPYLRAFQAWDHLEVMFRLPSGAANSDQVFESSAMRIHLFQNEEVYRYEVDVRDHAAPLPARIEFSSPASPSPVVPAGPVARPTGSTSPFALLLIAVGACLAGCAGVWLLLSRRTVSGVSARTFRQ